MTLTYIVLATLAGGLLSVLIAASLTVGVLSRLVHNLVSLSAGVLLGTALLHVLPEAFESQADAARAVRSRCWAGCCSSSCWKRPSSTATATTTKATATHHHHHFDAEQAGRGGWSVLVGDSIHNFCDGIIIAAAFLADPQLGVVTALAIVAHEIPQEVGDYIVLLNAGFSRAQGAAVQRAVGAGRGGGRRAGLLRRRPVGGPVPVPAGGGVQQLHLRGRGRPAAADAAPPALARDASQLAWLAGGLGVVMLATRCAALHVPRRTAAPASGPAAAAAPAAVRQRLIDQHRQC